MRITTNFQTNCRLQGIQRMRLLEMSVAAAIAYAAPCRTGDLGEIAGHYRECCLPLANDIISELNECIVVDTDGIMSKARKIWYARFEMLNSPLGCNGINEFHKELHAFGAEVATDYTYWVEQFMNHARTVNAKRETAVN